MTFRAFPYTCKAFNLTVLCTFIEVTFAKTFTGYCESECITSSVPHIGLRITLKMSVYCLFASSLCGVRCLKAGANISTLTVPSF